MKWENKTHEFDEKIIYLSNEFQKRKNIYIFGAGIGGENLRPVLEKYECFGGYIDNSIEKQERGVSGYSVLSLKEFMDLKNNSWIVIAADIKNIPDIIRQLESEQFVLDKDFFVYHKFFGEIFPILSVYLFNKVYVEITQICLTERCTLRCKKCAHACGYVDQQKQDMELEKVYLTADTYFKNVGYTGDFVLIGGEPLLYRELNKVVEYIGENYRDKIGVFSITTNGTILPNEKLLELCKKYGVIFRISNYSRAIPKLKEKYNAWENLLKRNNIFYTIQSENTEWFDYGFDYLNREVNEEELIEVFDKCKTPCSEIRENKFYFCVMARSVSENMKLNVGEEDYLDMNTLNGEQGMKEFLEYTMGYSDKGYLDMCRYCHGADVVNYKIEAAEQF